MELILITALFFVGCYGLKWHLYGVGYATSYRCLVSQLLNILTGGSWNETLSGRVGRRIEQGATPAPLWTALYHAINFLHADHDHCDMAALRDGLRRIAGTIPFLDPYPERADVIDFADR